MCLPVFPPSHARLPSRNLDQTIEEMSANFAEGTEYFEILVQVFQVPNTSFGVIQSAPCQQALHFVLQQGVLLGDNQKHLKNFFAIGEPLCSRNIGYTFSNSAVCLRAQ
jgi:hypothetical protein